ncbi:hypothetical protein MTQ01_06995 [Streptomyces sp. XM4193]|uniref:sigma factor-like helix-turn-helix DNA-binding protein n=1 Tax=Streptomyces sp. XM4193 TaxID=2929782 RepID=UPI001FF7EF4F|nr:sigma factor-like helix-turn-helix DNA-binding protein [Streptomyces sp. XM4193]MCK1795759.1 hypothetical protein [Streptomyces sp. XM4193]
MQSAFRLHRSLTPEEFAACGEARWEALVSTARLLTGDSTTGEDLARRALYSAAARRHRIPRGDVDFHLRRRLVALWLREERRTTGSRADAPDAGRAASRARRPATGDGRPAARRLGAAGRDARRRIVVRRARDRQFAQRRVALVLRYGGGMPETVIAQLLGCSPRAVRRLLRRGLRESGLDAAAARALYAAEAGSNEPAGPCPAVPTTPRKGRTALRAAAVAAGCVGVLLPSGLLLADQLRDSDLSGSSVVTSRMAVQDPVRVVTTGERVSGPGGTRIWLTEDSVQWSGPGGASGRAEVDEGRSGARKPGVSAEPPAGRLLTGLYYGVTDQLGRVEVEFGDSRQSAELLSLAGDPGWGVWYVPVPAADGDEHTGADGQFGDGRDERADRGARDAQREHGERNGQRVVTLRDDEGRVLARTEAAA